MNRSFFRYLGFASIAALVFISGLIGLTASAQAGEGGAAGYIYTESNATTGNQILVYARSASGGLTALPGISTGGTGTGAGLGSEGALALDQEGQWLIAVNAGSNDVSVISLRTNNVTDRVSSGGTTPISVTVNNRLVYVLNSGGAGNISGFRLSSKGKLSPIPGSTRPLGGTAPAQVKFSPDGEVLIVTEKGTSTIDSYTVDEHTGLAAGPISTPSSGAVPFGFDFGKHNTLVVSEAAVSAGSSYHVSDGGAVTLISGSVVNGQQAACWTVVTNNSRYAYLADAHNGMISSYALANDGTLTLLDGTAGTPGGIPLDEAVSRNDRFLYVLNVGLNALNAFGINSDGSLNTLANTPGVPASAAGLIAR